jgi:hypothetical protein
LILTPVLKAWAFLEIARQINAAAESVPPPPPPRPTPPDPFPLVPKEWARGSMEWQAEHDALVVAAAAALPAPPVVELAAVTGDSPSPEDPLRRVPTFFLGRW